MQISFILNLIKLKKEGRQIRDILNRVNPEEQNFASGKEDEIIYYNIYILTILPILRIVEIIKHALIQKYITNMPAFEPFTKEQIQDESQQIFNDFLDSLCQKGTMNIYKYIHNRITSRVSYNDLLKFATTSKSSIMQPNDFLRQSSLQLKHINGKIKVKPKMSDFYENTSDDHLQKNYQKNLTFDLLYIFIGDIHHHKLLEDPEYLYNQIQHMNPDYWKVKYTPTLHKISECIDEDIEESNLIQEKRPNHQQLQQSKQEFCCILKSICVYFVDLLKSLNVATLYYYSVVYSFQKFVNRIGSRDDLQSILYYSQNHHKERNYRQHLKDLLRGKTNYWKEMKNKYLLRQGEQEFIKIILNF